MMELNNQLDGVVQTINYEEIAASEPFKKLLAAKRRFIILITTFFIGFALLLPILAFYTNLLTRPAIGAVSWGWVFAFAQFAMTWIICHLYVMKAAQFDHMAKRILSQEEEGR